MKNEPITFYPPYLRYDDPNEFIQIQAKIKALKDKSGRPKLTLNESTVTINPTVFTASPIEPPINTKPPVTSSIEAKRTSVSGVTKSFDNQLSQPQTGSTGVSRPVAEIKLDKLQSDPSTVSVGKAASIFAHITPNGAVSLGFNCKMKFHVTNDLQADYVYWYLGFKDPVTGKYDAYDKYLGATSVPNEPTNEIYFEIDYSTYNVAAYKMANGTAEFKVYCEGFKFQLPFGMSSSEPVILNFNSMECLGVHSISLSENTFVGGKNDKEPTMTVSLNAPAPPGGQKIELGVSNSNLGHIMGTGYFTIPAGQTTESISWFLGTRKVYTNKDFCIQVRAAGSEHTGYANIYLKPK